MKKNLNVLPEIPQIEALLYTVQPVPGERFHHRMAVAPWNTPPLKSGKTFMMNRRSILVGILTGILLLVALGFYPCRESPGR